MLSMFPCSYLLFVRFLSIQFLCPFLIGSFAIGYMSYLYISDINALLTHELQYIFLQVAFFNSLIVSFAVEKSFSLMQSHFFLFVLLLMLFVSHQKKCCQIKVEMFLSMFTSRSFTVSGFMFKSLIHGVRQGSDFILLHAIVQFPQQNFLKTCLFSMVSSWVPCQI